jgi:metallo-beta-lactamase family protein
MCDAGRIRHHLKQWLWQHKATVLFVGYQAEGTMGRKLSDGAKHVTMLGEDIKVNAKIRSLDAYSGHADGSELARWIAERTPIRQALFLTHGEEGQMAALKDRVAAYGIEGSRVILPGLDDEVILSSTGKLTLTPSHEKRIARQAVKSPDWDNDLAALINDLRDGFEAAADEKSQAAYVRKVRRALALEENE